MTRFPVSVYAWKGEMSDKFEDRQSDDSVLKAREKNWEKITARVRK